MKARTSLPETNTLSPPCARLSRREVIWETILKFLLNLEGLFQYLEKAQYSLDFPLYKRVSTLTLLEQEVDLARTNYSF